MIGTGLVMFILNALVGYTCSHRFESHSIDLMMGKKLVRMNQPSASVNSSSGWI